MTSAWKASFLAGALLLLFALPSFSARKLQTSAVAQVGSHVLTSREVRMNALVDQMLYGAPSQPASDALLVQSVITEWCVYLEAESFSVSTVSEADVESKYRQVQKTLQGQPKWRELGGTEQELHQMVRRKLVAKSFMDFKTSSSRVPVSDEEALAYYQKNKAKFGDLPFESFKDSIVNYLVQSHLESRMREWLELLHSKYNVRHLTLGSEV